MTDIRMHATFQFEVRGSDVKALVLDALASIGWLLGPGQTLEDDVTWELDDIRSEIALVTSAGVRTHRTWTATVRGSIVVPDV